MLAKIHEKRKSGNERFILNNNEINNSLVEFWQWAFSGLSDNALRGSLAEYIVASALSINELVQENWKPYDLDYKNLKIEIKSSAYIQTWQQTDYSKINFSIRKSREWLADGSYSDEIKRQADVYIFCLQQHKDQESLNPMDLDQWTFYIVKTSVLNDVLGEMQQLSLSRLMKIDHVECGYGELREVIDEVRVDIKRIEMFMKNIIQIWEENGRKTPFCVSKGNWSDKNVYVIVESVEPDGKGYGKAYGTPVTNGKLNTYFDYDKKWKKEKLIPNPGVYNWKYRPDKEAILPDRSKLNDEPSKEVKSSTSHKSLELNDTMNFGKYKGKTIEFIIQNNQNYLIWALENINDFRLADDAMKLLNDKI